MQDGLDLSAVGAKPLSKLAMCLKPRYHFAALHQTFYERIPYRYSTSIPVYRILESANNSLKISIHLRLNIIISSERHLSIAFRKSENECDFTNRTKLLTVQNTIIHTSCPHPF